MRRIYLLIALSSITSLTVLSQNGDWLWVKDHFSNYCKGSEVSGNGFLVSGSYNSDSTITNPPLAYYSQITNAFLTKYDSNGDWLWYKSYGYDEPGGYAFCQQSLEAASGNTYALLKMELPYIFETDTFLNQGPLREDLILAKYDNYGTLIWRERLYPEISIPLGGIFPYSICCDNAENIYLNFSCSGALNIGDTLLSYDVTRMLCKFDSAGQLQWFINYSSYYCELDYNPFTDKIILSTFGGQDDVVIGDTTIYANDELGSFIAVINPANGHVETVKRFPGRLDTEHDKNLVFIDESGDIYFSTDHYDSIIIIEDTLQCNGQDCMLWKINPQFDLVWYQHIGGSNSQAITNIKVHPSGNVFLSLWCYTMVQLGNDTIWDEPTSTNKGIMQLGPDGSYKNMIGADISRISTNSFTFDGNDLIILGIAISDSIGDWPIDDYFMGRYKLTNIGINEFESNKMNLVAYPNPATNKVFVQSTIMIERVELYSISGKLVKCDEVNSQTYQFDVSDLNPGCYIIRGIGNHNILSRKLIVN